ncbi:STAS domain-containing protein [Streptomyces massasporeus]|uniref:STAS domain-containing protein n=1 Tax=Streptomyces massasporeus TaxID=67324 RepID=UPI00364F3E9A
MSNTEPAGQPSQLTVVSTTTADGIHVLTVTGEIDQTSGSRLQQAMAVPAGPRPRIVIDMSGVTFMDSTGINILILAHRALDDAGGSLRLAAPGESVTRVMHIVGLDTIIDCYPTLEQALNT